RPHRSLLGNWWCRIRPTKGFESPLSMSTITIKLGQVCTGTQCRRIPHNSNASMHPMARYRWNQAWKEDVRWRYLECRPANSIPSASRLPLERPKITFTLFTVQQLDQDNARTSLKPVLDALKERGGIGIIRDDSPRHLPEPRYEQVRV